MKMYTHKSGHYLATERIVNVRLSVHSHRTKSVTKYEINNLKDLTYFIVEADFVEKSDDWTPMFEVHVGEYEHYSQVDISNAIRKARECITNRIGEYKTTFQILNEFTEKIWQYLSK